MIGKEMPMVTTKALSSAGNRMPIVPSFSTGIHAVQHGSG